MIRKYLLAGQHIYLVSNKQEVPEDKFKVIEILLPMEVLEKATELLSKYNYLRSSNAENIQIKSATGAILTILAPYAISEKDRNWLYERSKSA